MGKLEKNHTKLTNIVWTYGPMCGYLDGFYWKGTIHEIRLPHKIQNLKPKTNKEPPPTPTPPDDS